MSYYSDERSSYRGSSQYPPSSLRRSKSADSAYTRRTDDTFEDETGFPVRCSSLNALDSVRDPELRAFTQPGILLLIVHKIFLQGPKKEIYFKSILGEQIVSYSDKATVGEVWKNGALYHFQAPLEFNVTDHLLRFGTLAFEIFAKRPLIPDQLLGRAELRINEISFPSGKTHGKESLPIRDKLTSLSKLNSEKVNELKPTIGSIDLSLGISQKEPRLKAGETVTQATHDSNLILDLFLNIPFISSTTREMLRHLYHITKVLFQGTGHVPIPAAIYSLALLMKFHEQIEPAPEYFHLDSLEHPPVRENFRFLNDVYWYSRYATAAYGWKHMLAMWKQFNFTNKQAVKGYLTHLKKEDILLFELGNGTTFQPNYFLVHDREKNVLVLGIRGTLSPTDGITDLVCEFVPLQNGLVHRGMKEAAEWLMSRVLPEMELHSKRLNVNNVVILGHSLGAGVAILACFLFKPWAPNIDWICYAFAPPHICSPTLANNSRVFSFVRNRDLVPRLCFGSVQDLRDNFLTALSFTKNYGGDLIKVFKNDANSPFLKPLVEELKKKREYLLTKNVNPKLMVAGTVYLMENIIQPSNESSKPMFSIFKKSEKRTLIRRVDPMLFQEILIKRDMFTDHLPLSYEAMLRRSVSPSYPAEENEGGKKL